MVPTSILSFKVDTTHPTIIFDFEAWIDDHKFFDTANEPLDLASFISATQGTFFPRTISTEIPSDTAEHELRFILKNKPDQFTTIDENNNILIDSSLTFSDLAVDDIVLTQTALDHFIYTHDFNGTQQLTQTKFHGEMGCNGTVSFKFTTPIYLWLLKNL
jgi:hypothetical protein